MKLRGLSSAVGSESIGVSLIFGRLSSTKVSNAADWFETCRRPLPIIAIVSR